MSKKVVCFGEVLWDILPIKKIAGGAPMNVALRMQSFGFESTIISKTGNDESGKELLSIIQPTNVDCSLIQKDSQLITGEVIVRLDTDGIATYEIVYPTAWDKIEFNEANKHAVSESDFFVFGSLSCRDEESRNTLFQLLEIARYKVFDVNLRAPFYTISLVEELMMKADFIKLNDEELNIIATALGACSINIEENIQFISNHTNTHSICVTKGENGAILFINNQFYKHPGFSVTVADTIGSGDSFLAAFLSKMAVSNDYEDALKFSCAVGAVVASKNGANPEIGCDEIEKLLKTEKV